MPQCGALVANGYCPDHQQRSTTTERLYGWKWQKFRRWYFMHPDNVMCKTAGCNKVAEHLHHLIKLRLRPDLQYVLSNLEGHCAEHHNALTAAGF
jgi:5-methylcytosine-specific restriction endonuclease McrA